jgi:hypothetical protein
MVWIQISGIERPKDVREVFPQNKLEKLIEVAPRRPATQVGFCYLMLAPWGQRNFLLRTEERHSERQGWEIQSFR